MRTTFSRRSLYVMLALSASVLFTGAAPSSDLQIVRTSPGQFKISWKAQLSQGFTLQSGTDFVSGWTPVSGTPTLNGARIEQPVITFNNQSFYQLTCTPTLLADVPDASHTDDNCDGIDGDLAQAVFVSVSTGNNGNDGSIDHPLQSIAAGITAAVNANKTQVLVADGNYTGGTLELKSGVSIYGGYDATTWLRTNNRPNYTNNQTGAAAHGASLNLPTTISQMTLNGGGRVGATAQSGYGVIVTDSTGLVLINCGITAVPGQAGSTGAHFFNSSGQAGTNGNSGCIGGGIACGSCSQPSGGPGGAFFGAGAAGGTPGFGTGGNGNAGGNVSGGAQGGAGATAGQPGSNGQNGADGAAGNQGTDAQVVFNSSGWVPPLATDGGNGSPSGAGGGGGGGHGGSVSGGLGGCTTYGSSGGGGGGGGAASHGGGAGTNGGCSIAVYLWNSNANISSCDLTAGTPGGGGAGGQGGGFGAGGAGGQPGAYVSNMGSATVGGAGGHGGFGGAGGKGGDAVNGGSVDIMLANGSTATTSNNHYATGLLVGPEVIFGAPSGAIATWP